MPVSAEVPINGVIHLLSESLSSAEQRVYRTVLQESGSPDQALSRLPEKIRKIITDRGRITEAEARIENWRKGGISLLDITSSEYPSELRAIYDPPLVLFYRGCLPARWTEQVRVAIVGTRRPDAGGVEIARQFGLQCGQAGICVVSGIAMGIDAAAHQGALDAGGSFPTIAVLGHGVDLSSRCGFDVGRGDFEGAAQ